MRSSLALAALLALAHCAPPRPLPAGATINRSCGILACVSSSYLAAKIGADVIGRPVSVALARAGAPTASYRAADGSETLSWRRQQRDDGMHLSCEETVTARGGVVASYNATGHC